MTISPKPQINDKIDHDPLGSPKAVIICATGMALFMLTGTIVFLLSGYNGVLWGQLVGVACVVAALVIGGLPMLFACRAERRARRTVRSVG
jgi:uncharacterized membrane protein YdjX (TVP38/TMEM64 family)